MYSNNGLHNGLMICHNGLMICVTFAFAHFRFTSARGRNLTAALDWRRLEAPPCVADATTCPNANATSTNDSEDTASKARGPCLPRVLPADVPAVEKMLLCVDYSLFEDLDVQYHTSGITASEVVAAADNNKNGMLECQELSLAVREYVLEIFWKHDDQQKAAMEALLACELPQP